MNRFFLKSHQSFPKHLKHCLFCHFSSLFSLFLAFLLVFPASAAIPDDKILDLYDKNGIYYYNPKGNDDTCNSSSTTLAGSDTAEKIWNYFTSHGFSDAQTAGILGNGMAESSLLPTRASNGSFWGLFQWGGGRKDQLFSKLQAANLSEYTNPTYWSAESAKSIPADKFDQILTIELDFTLSEHDLDWQNEIKKTNKPEVAAEIFLALFERAVGGNSPILYYSPFAGLNYQATKARRDFATEFFEKYSGKGVSVSGTSSTAENGSNLTIIGDSITVGSTSALRQKFPNLSISDINARNGRPWQEGITVAASLNLKNTIVFALGTNTNNLTQSDLNSAISTLGKERNIVFVTNYDGTTTYDNNNNLFKEFAKQNSNIIIADWASTVSKSPDVYLASDHIHPNSAGQTLFADTIYSAINSNTNENGCSVSGEFQSLVKSYAWPEHHSAPYTNRMPAYAEAVSQSISEGRYVGGSINGVPGIDCGGFVTILVQNSGIAKDYNNHNGATGEQEAWVKSHNWELINSSASSPVDTSLLQPGDVAFTSGHTFIYVGEIEGFNSVIASASYGQSSARAPMAGKEDLVRGHGVYARWYHNPNFNPAATTTTSASENQGNITNSSPSGATLLKDHHLTFYSGAASENAGYAGQNASSKYNNGRLAPGQAASSYLPLGTVVYVQTSASGEASYANGRYFLITDRGAGKIDGDYNLDIYHDVDNPTANNYPPYDSSSSAKIYLVENNLSWQDFKVKYGW